MEPIPQLFLWVRGMVVNEGRRSQRLVHDATLPREPVACSPRMKNE
jgi:hypothetical protein